MRAVDLPTRIQLPFADGAGPTYIRTVPVPSQIGVTPGAASYTDGFPPLNFQALALGGIPPAGQDFNGVLHDISGWARWLASGGPIDWSSTFATAIGGYPIRAIAQHGGIIWISDIDNNASEPGVANWTDLLTYIGGLTSAQIATLISIAIGAIPPSGVGEAPQAWHAADGVPNVTYTNTHGRAIQVAIALLSDASGALIFEVDGVTMLVGTGLLEFFVTCVIPPGATYELVSTTTIATISWATLR